MEVGEDLACYHCGQACDSVSFAIAEKNFCCYGCKVVYELLEDNNLCDYYQYETHPGATIRPVDDEAYVVLDDPAVQRRLLDFSSDSFARITWRVPAIHCVSCIWLLEKLRSLDAGILRSEVNFARKSVVVEFHPGRVSLRRIAARMASVGYPPVIDQVDNSKPEERDGKLLTVRLAIAGFSFGNIMLFSFPEYLGLDEQDTVLRTVFSWLNVALALPVLVFSARIYLDAAWKSFAQRQINIDVPIAAGLIALFGRSIWEIVTGYGPGYLDSFSGLVFFLLIGRWFQEKTYDSLSFDRDYKSYFPLAVQRWTGDTWKPTLIEELGPGDQVRIRNLEVIPADARLTDAEAFIDYSFVTGESRPVLAVANDFIYAGGRLIGQPARFRIEKKATQSYLTSLWNHASFRKNNERSYQRTIDRAARIFTWVVMGLAIVTALYWYFMSPGKMWLVMTSVLMVACPCALALAAPFTYGTMLRVFGRNRLYLKNTDVIERLSRIDCVVFDKTGTVTYGEQPAIVFEGVCSDEEMQATRLLTSCSTHPLSVLVSKSINGDLAADIKDFKEIPGKGIQGRVWGRDYRIGSSAFAGAPSPPHEGTVWLSVDGATLGCFRIGIRPREGMKDMIGQLAMQASLLSGDQDSDMISMRRIFGKNSDILFNQSPLNKQTYVKSMQEEGKQVLMVGDGLNDTGALKQSDVGIAVTDDTGVFTPSCDGILFGERVKDLHRFMRLTRSASGILRIAFAISFCYNAIALGIAITGHLTPLIAAILMPLSSISVVGFSVLAVNVTAKREGLS